MWDCPFNSYLWWDIVDIVISPLSSSLLSFPGEIVDILGGVTSSPQAGWDVIDLLGGLADPAPVSLIMLVSQDGGWDVVHVLWNGWLIIIVVEVVVQVLARRDGDLGLEFGKVGWYIVGLLSDWLSFRDVFTNRRGEVIHLKRKRERNILYYIKCYIFINVQRYIYITLIYMIYY